LKTFIGQMNVNERHEKPIGYSRHEGKICMPEPAERLK
jgi:hypothetical protein